MRFTDEELRVLKGMCEAGNWPVGGKALLPLLARLEAAEYALKLSLDEDEEYSFEAFRQAMQAWRKAAGR